MKVYIFCVYSSNLFESSVIISKNYIVFQSFHSLNLINNYKCIYNDLILFDIFKHLQTKMSKPNLENSEMELKLDINDMIPKDKQIIT